MTNTLRNCIYSLVFRGHYFCIVGFASFLEFVSVFYVRSKRKYKMAVFSKCVALPEDYGYVVFAAVGHTLLNVWLALNVGKARKEHKIEYPTMYSPDNNEFNCVQRAHQNTLENYPTFLCLLLIGGLQYPRVAAGAGAVYLVSRVAYAKGYYTGDPKNRRWGAFGHLSEMVLLGSTVSWACHLLGWAGKQY